MDDQPHDFLRSRLARLPPLPSFPEDSTGDTDTSTETDSSTASVRTVVPVSLPSALSTVSNAVPWNQYFTFNFRIPSSTHPTQSFNVYYTPPSAANAPIYVFHHGAGSSGLSFAICAGILRDSIQCGVIVFDVRYHGATDVGEGEGWELQLDTLARDELEVVQGVARREGWLEGEWPDLILVGHSLGGAVSAHLASQSLLPILCLCIIDVVEGSAINALQSMQTYLSTRPKSFTSLEQGVQWHLSSRTIRNMESARVSVPALLVQEQEVGKWIWRTDLGKTQPFWEDWFKGLSNKFLSARAGKLLLLAGTDRLDKPLMIGQMQGKYQLVVIPEAGHFVHEDVPARTAEGLIELWRRNDREAIKRVALLNKMKNVPQT